MTAFLKALDEAAVRWALCMAAIAVWLLLNAWLDGQPSETDVLQASSDVSESLAAMYAASQQTSARVAVKE